MRIAIDIRELRTDSLTGIARILRTALPLLARDNRNQYVLFANQFTDTANLSAANMKIVSRKEFFTFFYDQFTLPVLLKKEKIDVFLSPYFKCPLVKVCKYIVYIHDLHFLKPILRKGVEKLRPYLTYLKLVLKVADKVITVSNFSKKEIIKILNVPEEKIDVIYNPIGDNFLNFLPDNNKNEEVRVKYGLPDKYFLYVGNFFAHKNVQGLIMAYKILPKELLEGYNLVLVGKKDVNLRKIQNLISSLGLEERIKVIDFVCDNDIPYIYHGASLFIYPSFYEGFGYPPLEALACGTKVISSDAASLPEVLKDKVVYFNPQAPESIKNAILQGLEQPSPKVEELLSMYKSDKFIRELTQNVSI
ncbi:MAG: glycosyltransferase family 4 protein [Candidatus Omnitrophica bacterium]|nr:glycosyltransferase family 4 protein [Candidatus Omnitrophota bacterium]